MTGTCSRCGQSGLPILYGFPGDEMREDVEAGRAVLGGCAVDEGLPTHTCRACGASWGSVKYAPAPTSSGTSFWGDLEENVASSTEPGPGDRAAVWAAQIRSMLKQWGPLRPAPAPSWVQDDHQARMDEMRQEQRGLAERGLWLGGDKTLLQVLDLTRDEAAHTRLLAWLLRPDGHHRAGRASLLALGAAAEVSANRLSGPVRVVLEEERTTVDREDGEPPTTRADLIVRTTAVTLLVEAKVDAHEQHGQLDRLRRTWSKDPGLRVLLVARSSHEQFTSASGGSWPATSWARLADAVAERTPTPRNAELEAVLNMFRETP